MTATKLIRAELATEIQTYFSGEGIEFNTVYSYLPPSFGGESRIAYVHTTRGRAVKLAPGTREKTIGLFVVFVALLYDPDYPADVNPQQAHDDVDDMMDIMDNFALAKYVNSGFWHHFEILDYAETFINVRDKLVYWFASVPVELKTYL